MDVPTLRKKIQDQKEDFLRKDPGVRRPVFDRAVQALPLPNALLITGLRRVGKTTLMRQLYEYLRSQSVRPENIYFFSFDEHQTRNLPKNSSLFFSKTTLPHLNSRNFFFNPMKPCLPH